MMRFATTTIAGTLALMAVPLAAESERSAPTKGEVKLAKMLDGRVAGEARSCIRQFPSDRMTVIDGTALVFKRGGTLWVNYTKRPQNIDDRDALVIRKYGSGTQLCRTDIVSTIDRSAGFYTGNLFLSEFVPYRKVES